MASAYIEERTGKRGKRYRAVLEWRDRGKRRTKKSKWTRYWKRAKKLKDELLSQAEDIRLGIKKDRPAHYWSELAAAWKGARSNLRPNTLVVDKGLFDVIDREWGDVPLNEITKQKVAELREALRKTLADGSVGIRLRSLKAVLYYAVDELEWLDKHPMIGMEIPESPDRERVYSDAEFWEMLDVADKAIKGALILARMRAIRKGEMLMLAEDGSKKMLVKDADGDLWVRFRRPARFGIKSDRALKTKRKGERDVPLPAEALPYLDVEGTDGPVLPGLTEARLRYYWDKLRKKLDVVGRWHDWKHTSVTRQFEEGASTDDVLNLTGNTPQSLQRYDHALRRASKANLGRTSPPKSLPKRPGATPAKHSCLKSPDEKKNVPDRNRTCIACLEGSGAPVEPNACPTCKRPF